MYDILDGSRQDILRNGRAYTSSFLGAKGHPFLISPGGSVGDIWYSGIYYGNQRIRYDIDQDLIVLEWQDQTSGLVYLYSVSPMLVDSVLLDSRVFKYQNINSDNAALGMCQTIYDGPITLLKKYYKQFSETSSNPQGEFEYQVTYFMVKEGAVVRVKNKRTVLEYFNVRDRVTKAMLRGYKPEEGSEQQLIEFIKKMQ